MDEDEKNEQDSLGLLGPQPPSVTHYKLSPILSGAAEFDWEEGSGTTMPKKENQGSSSSCTEQMLGYMGFAHLGIQFTRRDGYSRIHHKNGGAYMWEPFFDLARNGLLLRIDGFADPIKQTEANMTELIVTDKNRKKWDLKYWQIGDTSIRGVAEAIKTYKVVGAGFYINWEKWADREHPIAREEGDPIDGSHALCLYDYGIDEDGPFILAKPSWRDDGKYPLYHKFRTNFFQPGQSHDFYVMEIKEHMADNNDGFIELVSNKGKVGVVEYIDTPENLAYQGKLHGFAVPIIRDDQGKPILGADGHIQIKWDEMNIKPVDF